MLPIEAKKQQVQRHEDRSGRRAHQMAEGRDQQVEEAATGASLRRISHAKIRPLGSQGPSLSWSQDRIKG